MITEYRVLGSLGIGTGILIHVAGFNCSMFHAPYQLTNGLWTLATVVLTFGCANYARGKGFSPWLGVSALIAPLGVVVVSLLPDRCKEEPTEVMQQLHEAKQQHKADMRRKR